ncbi:MAG TPA: F0F1 ATP synthase subunit A [Nevskiaceae bacterium]|nr:F0F1 ATP synthase subunit A [Nevskiaceae bacterium]
MGLFFASEVPVVSVAPETLFHLGPFAVTNSQLLGVLGIGLILTMFFTAVRQIRRGARNRFVHMVMWAFESLYDTTVEVIGDKAVARKVMPLAVTLLFFFLVNNWLGILPFVGPLTYNGIPLFRGAAADMNTTFALAIISMTTAQVWAIRRHGFFGNIRRYLISPFKDPLHSFEGALEIVAEFSRTLALSLRIFGNVFGGEVLLAVIAYLTSWAAPLALPLFYVLELFVGAVQAYVFFMLTVAFISLGLPQGDGHDDSHATEEAQVSSK